MLYRFDECELDDRLYQLRRKGERIEIEPKAFDLLVYLFHRREQVVAKDELLDKVWPGTVVSEAALTRCMARAREAVGDDGEKQQIIKTQHGRGYRFVTAVIEHPLEPETAPTATERALSPPSSRPTPSGCPSTIPAAGVAQQDATREWPAPVVVAISGTVQYLSLRLPAPSASRSSPTTARRVWRRPRMKLSGIRVLDLSRFLPGPYLTMLMADHGAEVIKIESYQGEPTRQLGPPVAGHPVYFRNTQRGKRSLTLNLKHDEGREIFLRLAAQSDVLVESFRPGVMDRLGLGYHAVQERAPGIIYCSLSAFGQTGPLSQRPSHDLGAQALTGVLSLSQAPGRALSLPTLPMADIALGSSALVGILMALLRRERTGQGEYLDVAMADALMSWTPHILSSVLAEDRPPDLSQERLHGGAAFYNIYRTADNGYLVLSGAELNFVENLLTALGRPDLIPLCRKPWGPAQDPVKHFLAETFATRTRDEWDTWLADKGVCYAPVLDLQEAWQGEQLRARGMILRGSDGVEHLGTPVKFAREPGHPSGAIPGLGEHTDLILERLGYDENERRRLKQAGVC